MLTPEQIEKLQQWRARVIEKHGSVAAYYRTPERIADLAYNTAKIEGLNPSMERLVEFARELLEKEKNNAPTGDV
jgi:hypothetical protein